MTELWTSADELGLPPHVERVVPSSSDMLAILADEVREALPGVEVLYWPRTLSISQPNGPNLVALAGDTICWDSVRVWRVTREDG